METNQIIESNKLIAEFMGYKIKGGLWGEQPKYNSSWDWLMPVVEKIEMLNIDGDKQIYINVEFDNREEFMGWYGNIEIGYKTLKCFDDRIKTKIDMYYIVVCYFIKWYNQNQAL